MKAQKFGLLDSHVFKESFSILSWSGWESQALEINNDFKISFNYWIDIEIRIKFEIENELHRD
jgi:hypothetical protein